MLNGVKVCCVEPKALLRLVLIVHVSVLWLLRYHLRNVGQNIGCVQCKRFLDSLMVLCAWFN